MRFYQQLAALEPEKVAPYPPGHVAGCVPLVGERDAHVLTAGLSVKVMTPEDFFKKIVATGYGGWSM